MCRIESRGLKVSTLTRVCIYIAVHGLCLYIQVSGATLDAKSVNHRFIKLHSAGSEMVHKVPNPFTSEDRQLLFFSDPPHQMKDGQELLDHSARGHSGYVCGP